MKRAVKNMLGRLLGKASTPRLFAINTEVPTSYIYFIFFWFRTHDFQTCFQLGKRGSNDNVVG